MELTKEDKAFIKRNKIELSKLFEKRIEELKWTIGDIDPNLTAEEFKIKYLGYKNHINEMVEWLRAIKVLQEEKDDKSPTGI